MSKVSRGLHKSWKDFKRGPGGAQQGSFTRRIRWYDTRNDDKVDIRLELTDDLGTVQVFYDNKEQADDLWAAFKAGTVNTDMVRAAGKAGEHWYAAGTLTGKVRKAPGA